MPMRYAPIDLALAVNVTLGYQKQVTIFDRKLQSVEFQFPPKITTDSRKGTWDEKETPGGTEPIATFSASGPRELTLAFTYIVDGGEWTTDRIAANLHFLRGYFAQVRANNDQRNLVAYFQMWRFGGPTPMSFRVKSIDVKQSDTIIAPCQGRIAQVSRAFPLRSDVTMELRMWTQGNSVHEKVMDVLGLKESEPPEWY